MVPSSVVQPQLSLDGLVRGPLSHTIVWPDGVLTSPNEEIPVASKTPPMISRQQIILPSAKKFHPLAILASVGISFLYTFRLISSTTSVHLIKNSVTGQEGNVNLGEFAKLCGVAGIVWLWAKTMNRLIEFVVRSPQ